MQVDACLPYKKVTRSINTVEEALKSGCKRWSSDDQVYRSLRRGDAISELRYLCVGNRFGKDAGSSTMLCECAERKM